MKKKFSERRPFHLIFHVMLDQGSMLIDAARCQPKFEEWAAKRPEALFLYEFSSFMSSLLEVELIVLVLLHLQLNCLCSLHPVCWLCFC